MRSNFIQKKNLADLIDSPVMVGKQLFQVVITADIK